MSEPPAKRKRVEIAPQVKREISKKKEENATMTIKDLQDFAKINFAVDISKQTMSDILKNKERWLKITDSENGSRVRPPKHKELEDALALWFETVRSQSQTCTHRSVLPLILLIRTFR